MSTDRPAIRPLEVERIDEPKGRGIVLIDRLGVSEPSFIPEGLLPIVGRCTGERTLAEILAEAAPQYDDPLTEEFIRAVVQQLDDRLLLLGPRFEAAVERIADGFLAASVRPTRHHGSAGYPAEPDALRAALDAMLAIADPEPAAPTNSDLRGLIAPHIDLARGADGYAAAYRRLLKAPPAELYVIFGTGHSGPTSPVTGLAMDWQTPLGIVETDRAFVHAVHQAIGEPSKADLLQHRDEHSLEFQVVMLQHLHARRGVEMPLRIAGFLCGALPSGSGDPLAEDYITELLAAFRGAEQATAGRVCYIAGADLAHIGPIFGDPTAVDDARLERLAAAERDRLGLLERARPGAFHAAVCRDQNPDRVCSGPAITLAAELAGGSGELLHYGQARAGDGSQTVSFCAMAFAGQA